MNELAVIFARMGIDTRDVLAAAGTKWNFLPFTPGLVGGHCIGVDPYYLAHKAAMLSYQPEVILAGRRVNDGMGTWVAGQAVKALVRRGLGAHGTVVTILGLTFKENVSDLRNTRVVDIVRELGGLRSHRPGPRPLRRPGGGGSGVRHQDCRPRGASPGRCRHPRRLARHVRRAGMAERHRPAARRTRDRHRREGRARPCDPAPRDRAPAALNGGCESCGVRFRIRPASLVTGRVREDRDNTGFRRRTPANGCPG